MLYFTDQKGSVFVLSLMQALVEVSLLEIKIVCKSQPESMCKSQPENSFFL